MSAGTFPQSSIPLDAEPGPDWATCGTCGRTFPDIYPAARCPFEYDHETEIHTMTDDTTTPATPEPQTREGAAVLRAFESIGAILGGSLQWDSSHLEYIAEAFDRAGRVLGLPSVSDQDEAAHRYWAAVGDRYGFDHDDLDELYGAEGDDDDDDDSEASAAFDSMLGHPLQALDSLTITPEQEG